MTNLKKQPKINKFLQRKPKALEVPQDCEELAEEIQRLRNLLAEKKDELFHLQRNSIKIVERELRQEPESPQQEVFVRPEAIILNNSVETSKHDLHLLSMITGMEVKSYVDNDHCVILYHMQHDAEHEVTHGLKISMRSGANMVSESSLPFGFNLDAVLDSYDNVMLPECLGAVRKALVAYYDRLEQFNALKQMLNIDAQLIRNVDGTHIEVVFAARSELEETGNEILVTVMLDYRLYDIRPKQFYVVEIDLPEATVAALNFQCAAFKKKCLTDAFKDAFIDGAGRYLIIKQFGLQPEVQNTRRRKRRNHNPYNQNDDTFRPEDCSQSEEDQDE